MTSTSTSPYWEQIMRERVDMLRESYGITFTCQVESVRGDAWVRLACTTDAEVLFDDFEKAAQYLRGWLDAQGRVARIQRELANWRTAR